MDENLEECQVNYMKIANEMAKQNLLLNFGGPFGAVIVKDNIVVGIGKNEVLKNNDPTAHAEIQAIRNACKNLNTYDLSNCVIYTSCYPCPMCMSAIIWSNIKDVYYANTKEDAADIGFRDSDMYEFFKDINNSDLIIFHKMDKTDTIQTFEQYKQQEKTIY